MYCSLAALEVVWVGFTIQDVGRVRGHLDPVHAVLDSVHGMRRRGRRRGARYEEKDREAEMQSCRGGDGMTRGRVTAHHIMQPPSGLEEDDDRRQEPGKGTVTPAPIYL